MNRPSRCVRLRPRFGALAAAGGLVAALSWAMPATATHATGTQVFHSPNDNGQPAGGFPEVPSGGVRSLYLYIDGGASASPVGTPCDTGTGNEVCGYTLTLTALTGLTLAAFTPDPGANLLYDITGLELRVNGLDTLAPTPGPKRIGELLVNGAEGGSLQLSSGEVIAADLSSEILAGAEVVYLPEPGALLLLASGVALLGCLGYRRARP